MMKAHRTRALVTGVSGQDGSYLAEQLLAGGAEVFGLVRSRDERVPAGVEALIGDMLDAASLRRAVERSRPDEVYNLAAVTFVPSAEGSPALTRDVNAGGVARLLEAMRDAAAPSARFCQASSSQVFGPAAAGLAGEAWPRAPLGPYGESKAEADRIVERYRREHGVFACSAILFNHESPRRPDHFVTKKIARAAARIRAGLEATLELGSLDAERDWGYAPEYVAAMRTMLGASRPSDYVIATGRLTSVARFAELAFAHVGLDWKRHVASDPSLVRTGDHGALAGDATRIERDLGWKATTTVEALAALMVDAEIEEIGDRYLFPPRRK